MTEERKPGAAWAEIIRRSDEEFPKAFMPDVLLEGSVLDRPLSGPGAVKTFFTATRGMYDETAVNELHSWMNEELRAAGAHIDDMRYCPHHPQARIAAYRTACSCRKPAAGMLLDLMDCWPVIRQGSIMIGDKESDAAAGRTAGIASVIVPAGALEGYVKQLLESTRGS